MTNDQILLYLNSSSFLSFSEWCCYPSFTNDSLFYFSPVDRDDICIKDRIARGIAILIRDNQIKEDELKQEIAELIAENLSNQTQYIEKLEALEKVHKEEIEALKRWYASELSQRTKRIAELEKELSFFRGLSDNPIKLHSIEEVSNNLTKTTLTEKD